jgi:hypothetical protein
MRAVFLWTFTIYTTRGQFSSRRIDIQTDEQHSSDNMDEQSHAWRPDFLLGGFA